MKTFKEYINEESKKFKLSFGGVADKYKMLEGAEVIVLKKTKNTSEVKVVDLENTDLYRPKTDGVTKEQMIKSSNKTFLNKTFNIKNKYIIKNN